MVENKVQPATVDEYISSFDPEMQQVLQQLRAVIKEAAPDAEEKISYQMVGYYLNGGLVWFGAFKRHIGIYPRTAAMDAIEGLSAYTGTKGSVHFPLNKPLPFGLIRQVVKARVEENSNA